MPSVTAVSFLMRLAACLPLMSCATPAGADATGPAAPTVQRDLVYGQGIVGASTEPRPRDLKLDAYLPAASTGPSPAILMIFGGAYHRGSKEDEHFAEDGAQDSTMAEYCGMFAQNGIACFAIDYRLTPEDPAPPQSLRPAPTVPKALLQDPAATARIALVRQAMGLPALDAVSREQYWAATFAAVEDAQTALAYIRSRAGAFGIDPDRIAAGGFSAGAITALNLAYGARADVSAVISLSGGIWGYDLTQDIDPAGPPVLLFVGQTDLPGMRWGSAEIAKRWKASGLKAATAWVPGFGHFYPMGATSLGEDFSKLSVQERMIAFLEEVNAPPQP